MVAELTAVAVLFTHKPVIVHCPDSWRHPAVAGYTIIGAPVSHIYLPRPTCLDLATTRTPQALDTFTHEMIHVRNPRVRHGTQMKAAVSRYLATVTRLLEKLFLER